MVDDLSGPAGPLPPLTAIPDDVLALADYEKRAKAHLPPASWAHVQDGSGAGVTLADNRAVFDRLRLLPHALADLRQGDTAIHLFGRRHAAPILLAPIAYQTLAHPDGELAVARAAAALETGMALSTLSGVTLEAVAAASRAASVELRKPDAPLWFQLYLQPERADNLALVRRAEAAGYEAVVLTIDAGLKRSSFTLPPGVDAANLKGMTRARHVAQAESGLLFGTPIIDAMPRWDDLAWLRAATKLPVIVKGMAVGADLDRMIDAGVDGLILSNHGGRVLDGLPTSLELLPDVRDTIAGRIPILIDGGVRTGVDIVKALCLGASAVLVGRPQIHALAVAGMPGVAHMLQILRVELEAAMAQLGCPDPSSLTGERLFDRAR